MNRMLPESSGLFDGWHRFGLLLLAVLLFGVVLYHLYPSQGAATVSRGPAREESPKVPEPAPTPVLAQPAPTPVLAQPEPLHEPRRIP